MDQTANAISAEDAARCRLIADSATRSPLAQSLVWPRIVVVLNELAEHVFKMATTEDQQVIEDPHLAVPAACTFYRDAFGAVELFRNRLPDGRSGTKFRTSPATAASNEVSGEIELHRVADIVRTREDR